MSNSSLVNYTRISPNRHSPRNHVIDTVTIHVVVGQVTVERLGDIFAPESKQASANYGIGSDGRIGMYCEESDRSWCSSNEDNDNRAVTIECASDSKAPYAINDKVYKSLINLCADICKRNNIKELKWKADKKLIGQVDKQNMTVHRWFANKSCPGDYVYSRLGQIAEDVNKQLKVPVEEDPTTFYTMIEGKSVATAKQIIEYIKNVNPNIDQSVIDMIQYYISEGEAENIRGDVAFAQSCIETGNFKFQGGTAVTIDQNNFCGHGVTKMGLKGSSFETPQMGIRAQIQHLKAYANTEKLVNECVDNRFKYVQRGTAKYVEWLGIPDNPFGKGWAAGKGYGFNVMRVLNNIISTHAEEPKPINKYPDVPFTVKVLVDDLDVHANPSGKEDNISRHTGKGIFTIVHVSGDYGLLKSKAGWINLSDSTKCTVSEEVVETPKFQPYAVKVSITNLRIRKGPTTNSEIAKDPSTSNGCIKPGTYTIVEEVKGEGSNKGWGKLKSGLGWLSLDYVTKL